MRVGIPCMKCSLHPSQQVNKKTGKASKTCGTGSAWREMNDERLGRDPTIDKTMTEKNVWMVGNSNDDVEEIVQKEIDSINEIRREAGKRALRSDCVSVVAIVEKPNMEYMQNLSYEERKQFLLTSHEVMNDLIQEWNPNWKVLESVQHHDEFGGLSAHNHTLVMLKTIDKNGLPNMQAKSELNLKFFNYVNSNYSKEMQKRGYSVEDVKTYDRLSEEEKLERKNNPREYGVDSYTFKKNKENELSRFIVEKQTVVDSLSNEIKDQLLVKYQIENVKHIKDIVSENQKLKVEIEEKNNIIADLKNKVVNLQRRITELSNKVGNRILKMLGFETEDNRNIYPDKSLIDEVNKIQNKLVIDDPSNYRVVPDDKNKGCFKVVVKKQNNYEVVESGLKSRKDAELKVKEMKKLFNGLVIENQREIKRK